MIWLLIGYMFLFIHRPFEIWPTLGTYHLERVYMLGVMALWLVTSGKRWLSNRLHAAFFAFAAVLVLSLIVSPWSYACERTVEDYFKLLVFYVLLVTTIHNEKSLKRIGLAYLAVMGLYMTHSLLEYINGRYVFRMETPRMIGVDTSMGDPNSFGATIVYALPFVLPFWKCNPSPRLRWFLASYVTLSIVCILLTGSRSSLMGLLLAGLLMIWRTQWRGRLLVLALVLAPLGWAFLPSSLQTRFETIINPAVGPANAQASAQSRLDGLFIGAQLWEQYPLTGCGPGAWRPASGMKLESHNLYGQVIGETGTLGACAFAAVVLGYWITLRRMKKLYREHPEWREDFPLQLSRAIGLSLLLLLVMGNFGHNLYRYSWLWYGGFLVIAHYCVQQRLAHCAAVRAQRPTTAWRAPALRPGLAYGA